MTRIVILPYDRQFTYDIWFSSNIMNEVDFSIQILIELAV